MTIERIRLPGLWVNNSTVLDTEFEAIDANLAKAIDGVDGGTYAPTERIIIGGAGLFADPFYASGLSDIPMRGAFPPIDTGAIADGATTSSMFGWCPFTQYPQWVFLQNEKCLSSLDEAQLVPTTPAVTGPVAWNGIAANSSRVVAINAQSPANYADDAATLVWAACTGGLATGVWTAIVWDGTRFIAANDSGQFSYSAAGASWSAPVNGNPQWLAGPNAGVQLAAGKGPGGVVDRTYAVSSIGNTQYFAYSTNNGVSWGEVDTGIVGKTWRGIAYRASDHIWAAIAQDGTVAMSEDGGATWSTVTTISTYSLFHRLYNVNDYFVTLGSGFGYRMIYSRDLLNWKRGLDATRRTGYITGQLAPGNGGLAFAQIKLDSNIFLRFSQKSAAATDAI